MERRPSAVRGQRRRAHSSRRLRDRQSRRRLRPHLRHRGSVVQRWTLALPRNAQRQSHAARDAAARRARAQGQARRAALRREAHPSHSARHRHARGHPDGCGAAAARDEMSTLFAPARFFSRSLRLSIRARRTPFKLRKLLVIDDDAKLIGYYCELLKPYGFEVLTALDGQDAVPLVENNPDIMLVILDLSMPRMDGREWLRWF